MAQIKHLDGLSGRDLARELDHGAHFVMYQYTISIIVMTFRRSSDIHFVRAGESRVIRGLGYTLLTFLLGWWGIPWGPIYTIGSLVTNLGGGKDVTQEVLASMQVSADAAGPEKEPQLAEV